MKLNLQELQRDVHELAVIKGWWNNKAEALREAKFTLVHSELSEAAEAVRVGDMDTRISETGKPEGFFVELADAVIRILDVDMAYGFTIAEDIRIFDVRVEELTPEEILAELCPIHRAVSDVRTQDAIAECFELAARLGYNLMDAIMLKHGYNHTRAFRHGNKLA